MTSGTGTFAQGTCGSVVCFAQGSNYSAIFAFAIYIALVFVLAVLSNRLRQSKSFLSEYFLGSRSLGVWAFALTFAATSASGGSFMGFPSLVYTHGWILALWIAGYMLVPIVAIGLLAKRINQISRKTNAITIPDMMRGRFDSPSIGVVATYFIVFFMVFNLVAQFKAGSKILQTLLSGVPLFESAVAMVGAVTGAIGIGADPAYVLCLLVFGVVVVAYTTYGGFRAVVWTDVLQGFFMVGGVLFMLPVAIWAVGGLGKATEKLSQMKPPQEFRVSIEGATRTLPKNQWLFAPLSGVESGDDESDGDESDGDESNDDQPNDADGKRLFRVKETAEFPGSDRIYVLTVIEVTEIPQKEIPERVSLEPEFADLKLRLIERLSKESVAAGKYVTVPGAKPNSNEAFLPFALAISFYFFWTFSGAGQPSNMVRLMAFKDCTTLKRAIFTVCIYYSLIYFPIVIIFCCAKVLMPGWETDSDRIMPEMASLLTQLIEMPWLAGVLVAAPFAAVMSTMDSFLLMISSSFVRDIYQRRHPEVSESKIKRITYVTTIVVGVGAMVAAINPPRFLQDLIVFYGGRPVHNFPGPRFPLPVLEADQHRGCHGGDGDRILCTRTGVCDRLLGERRIQGLLFMGIRPFCARRVFFVDRLRRFFVGNRSAFAGNGVEILLSQKECEIEPRQQKCSLSLCLQYKLDALASELQQAIHWAPARAIIFYGQGSVLESTPTAGIDAETDASGNQYPCTRWRVRACMNSHSKVNDKTKPCNYVTTSYVTGSGRPILLVRKFPDQVGCLLIGLFIIGPHFINSFPQDLGRNVGGKIFGQFLNQASG